MERDAVYEELRPQCLALAKDKYAYHIVIKMMDNGIYLNNYCFLKKSSGPHSLTSENCLFIILEIVKAQKHLRMQKFSFCMQESLDQCLFLELPPISENDFVLCSS